MHSGTTIFWRAWRRDDRLQCFDEPFSGLGGLPRDDARGTLSELVDLFKHQTDPDSFWKRYAPLHPLEELDASFTDGQIDYAQFLLEQSSRVVIDETHLHLHLPALAELASYAHVIHLYRRARGFVTSHLRPSWSRETTWWRRAVRRMRHEHNKHVFWTRQDQPPGLRRDVVIGRHPLSKFGLMLSEAGYDAERIMASPAVVRLLSYWHFHFHYLEREGPRLFGERFKSVRYEDFATDPAGVMGPLYDWIKLARPECLSFPEVHAPKPPYRPRDPRWREAARVAGFDDEELETLL